eukprot:TRINITY_DN7002_c0_g1_i1.p1 TRINITY_DN7002_c0_g1~~TRINITY_DN7002_c0_g1_i1.p1  ORF type:complete len:437 (-),score=193.79 TRINITY_DN7002_c0_g1_i1:34-1344(-)
MNKIIEEEYLIPFNKRLNENSKSYSLFESKIVKANKDLDSNIQKQHAITQAQRKKDPAVMLKSMEDLTKAVADADVKREEMLLDLNFIEQERYCDWFKTFSGFLQTRLEYHEKSLERMKQLKEKWYNLAVLNPIAPPSSQWSASNSATNSSTTSPDSVHEHKTSLENTNSKSFESKEALAKSSSEESKEKKAERGNSFIVDGIKKFATLRGKKQSNQPPKTDRNLKIGSPHLVSSTTSSPNSIFAGLQPVGKCKVIFDYQAQRDDELSLKTGEVVVVLRKQEDDWWLGILNNTSGVFPSTFVEEIPMDEKDSIIIDPPPIPESLSGELSGDSKPKEKTETSETENGSKVEEAETTKSLPKSASGNHPPPPLKTSESKREVSREEEEAGLPPGWEVFTTDEGEKYYHNEELNQTTWDFPMENSQTEQSPPNENDLKP